MSGLPHIPNHYAPSLSALDREIIRHVPPGGNWKDIPASVPSRRLDNIRRSYAAGEGSRSTYYGRLSPEAPSYTINTYFARPGNGCHIHYDTQQNRTLSAREAARLQSFPDSFEFVGSRSAIERQIGNAVPPLLALQIAQHLPFKGGYIDLFAGAGGLSLGFKWAGWEPIAANDIDSAALATYSKNIHSRTIPGDIRAADFAKQISSAVATWRSSNPSSPLLVLGGPPCQGFSTAGNRRSLEDERNWLFRQYKEVLLAVRPDAFVFENVPGLLNMQKGKVYEMVRAELEAASERLHVWLLDAEKYGVPQRRRRVFLIGDNSSSVPTLPPRELTSFGDRLHLFGQRAPTPSVRSALDDLPPLEPGQDGSGLPYRQSPQNPYQEFVRGQLSPADYLASLLEGAHAL